MEELVVSGMGQFDKNNTHCHPLQTERRTERFIKQFKGKTPFTKNKPHFANRKKKPEKIETDTQSLIMSQGGASPSLNQTHGNGFRNGPLTPTAVNNLLASQTNPLPLDPVGAEAVAAILGSQNSLQFG